VIDKTFTDFDPTCALKRLVWKYDSCGADTHVPKNVFLVHNVIVNAVETIQENHKLLMKLVFCVHLKLKVNSYFGM